MRCGRFLAGLVLAALALPIYVSLESWMLTLVDRSDAASVIGFVAWSAFFFYLAARGIWAAVALPVDKTVSVK